MQLGELCQLVKRSGSESRTTLLTKSFAKLGKDLHDFTEQIISIGSLEILEIGSVPAFTRRLPGKNRAHLCVEIWIKEERK